MDTNNIGRQRLARLEEHDREVLKTDMSPAKTCFYIGVALSVAFFLLAVFLFDKYWLGLVGAVLLAGGGRCIDYLSNRDLRRDLAEDEKIVTVRKIEKLEVNPKTGTFVGGPLSASDRSVHDLYQAGYFVKIGNLWYPVRKEEFEAMQGAEVCEVHTAQYSQTFLDCTAIKK